MRSHARHSSRRLAILALALGTLVSARAEDAPIDLSDEALDALLLGQAPAVPVASESPADPTAAIDPAIPLDPALDAEAELLALLGLGRWSWDGEFVAGLGWSSNPLYLDKDEPGGAFLTVSGEIAGLRLPARGGLTLSAYALLERRMYLEDKGLFRDEMLGMLHGKATWVRRWLALSLQGQATYTDQGFGIAVSPIQTETFGLAAWQFQLAPGAEVMATRAFSVFVRLPSDRAFFNTGTDDYWEPAVQAGFRYRGTRDHVEASARLGYRDHDDRPARSIFGNQRAGTHLVWKTWRHELVWKHWWDEARDLRTTTRLRWRGVEDNYVSFDDYDAWEVVQEVSWSSGPWAFELSASAAEPRYRFRRPVISVPEQREQEQVYLEARVTRALAGRWSVSAHLTHDRLVSNLAGEDYRATTVGLALRRSFGGEPVAEAVRPE